MSEKIIKEFESLCFPLQIAAIDDCHNNAHVSLTLSAMRKITEKQKFAIVRYPEHRVGSNPAKVLVLDEIQNPGNLGTLIRSAFAFGFQAVCCIKCADPLSPKVIDYSAGYNLRIPIFDHFPFDLPLVCAVPGAKLPQQQFSKFALVLGNEARGITRFKGINVGIGMNGQCDSLNVGVAGSILMHFFNTFN